MLTKTIFRLNFFSKTSLKYFARSFPKKNSSSYQTPIQELNVYSLRISLKTNIFFRLMKNLKLLKMKYFQKNLQTPKKQAMA